MYGDLQAATGRSLPTIAALESRRWSLAIQSPPRPDPSPASQKLPFQSRAEMIETRRCRSFADCRANG
jgi:hypothetical protein